MINWFICRYLWFCPSENYNSWLLNFYCWHERKPSNNLSGQPGTQNNQYRNDSCYLATSLKVLWTFLASFLSNGHQQYVGSVGCVFGIMFFFSSPIYIRYCFTNKESTVPPSHFLLVHKIIKLAQSESNIKQMINFTHFQSDVCLEKQKSITFRCLPYCHSKG